MAVDPRIRASDEDRDRAASLLREHHAVGRLTPEEFSAVSYTHLTLPTNREV